MRLASAVMISTSPSPWLAVKSAAMAVCAASASRPTTRPPGDTRPASKSTIPRGPQPRSIALCPGRKPTRSSRAAPSAASSSARRCSLALSPRCCPARRPRWHRARYLSADAPIPPCCTTSSFPQNMIPSGSCHRPGVAACPPANLVARSPASGSATATASSRCHASAGLLASLALMNVHSMHRPRGDGADDGDRPG